MDIEDGADSCNVDATDKQSRSWLARLTTILECFPCSCLVADRGGRIVSANRHAADMFGYTCANLEGRDLGDLVPPRFRDTHARYCHEYFEAPQPRVMGAKRELFGLRSDGCEFPVEIGLAPVDLPEGTVAICTIVDLDVRDEHRSAFLESRRLLQQIVDKTAAVIYVKDREGRYELVNRRCAEVAGKTPAEIVGRDDSQVFPTETAAAFRQNDRQVLDAGDTVQVEEVAPGSDGPHHFVSVKFPLYDSDGRIRSVAGISTDITELVRTRRELETVNRRLELLLHSVSDGIHGLDEHGRITFVNRVAERMLGWSAEEVLGHPVHHLIHHSHADGRRYAAEDCPIHSVIQEATVNSVEGEVFWRKDGRHFPVEYSSSPLVDEGCIVGAVVTFRDATERIRRAQLESDLRTAQFVQQQLYPTAPPEMAGFDISGATFPAAQVCGDYFDFIPVSDGGTVLAVGDVCGHGLASALHMVETRTSLRALLRSTDALDDALRDLNAVLHDDIPEDTFVSLFLARLDEDRRFSYVGAGHNAWLLDANGQHQQLRSSGMLLGLSENLEISVRKETVLTPGALLLMLTDGIQEAASMNGDLFGMARVLETVRSQQHQTSARIIEHLREAVAEFCGARAITDDMTVVVAKVA